MNIPDAVKGLDLQPRRGLSPEQQLLVRENIELVRKIAGSFIRRLPPHILLDDLISEVSLGLIDAAKKYNPSLNNSFSAYASLRIRGAIKDFLRSLDHLPRSQRAKVKKNGTESGQSAPPVSLDLLLESGSEPLIDPASSPLDALLSSQRELIAKQFSSYFVKPPAEVSSSVVLEINGKCMSVSPMEYRAMYCLVQNQFYARHLREIGNELDVTVGRVSQMLTDAKRKIKELLEKFA